MRRSLGSFHILLLATAAACSSEGGQPVVGFAYARNGADYLDLARAALTDAGHALPVFRYDSGSGLESTDSALAFAAALAGDPRIAVVVGPSNSRHALATAPAYNAAHIPQVIPSATSRRLVSAGPYTFTLAPNDSVEGDYLARFAVGAFHARRAILFYVNDEYGEGLRAGILSAFVGHGGVVEATVPIGRGTDIPLLLTGALRGHHPDVVFVAGRSVETALVLRSLRAIHHPLPVVAGDGAYLPSALHETAGPDLDGLYVLAFWVYDSTDPAHRAFATRVAGLRHTGPTPEDALTEDALRLAVAALDSAGPDREAIRKWLADLGVTRPPFLGLSGRISFGPRREHPLAIVRFRNGGVERMPDSLVAPASAP